MDAKERQARADYGQQLNALKSATKPEINFLTMLAQDYVPYAPAVRDVLVDRIKNRPGNNLHLLYLMDSICKIVQGPYPPLFAERIYDIVYNVAAQGSRAVQDRVKHTQNTWVATRTFPPNALAQAERAYADALRFSQQFHGSVDAEPQRQRPTDATPAHQQHTYRERDAYHGHGRHPAVPAVSSSIASSSAPYQPQSSQYGHTSRADPQFHRDHRSSEWAPSNTRYHDEPYYPSRGGGHAHRGRGGYHERAGGRSRTHPDHYWDNPHAGRGRDDHYHQHAHPGQRPDTFREHRQSQRSGPDPRRNRRAAAEEPSHHPEAQRYQPQHAFDRHHHHHHHHHHQQQESRRGLLGDRATAAPAPLTSQYEAARGPEPPRASRDASNTATATGIGSPSTPNDRTAMSRTSSVPMTPNGLFEKLIGFGLIDPTSPTGEGNKKRWLGSALPRLSLSQDTIKGPLAQAFVDVLYDDNATSQCHQCGMRFPKDKKMEQDLHQDWHFRRNNRIKNSTIITRGWFLPKQEWVELTDAAIQESAESDPSTTSTSLATTPGDRITQHHTATAISKTATTTSASTTTRPVLDSGPIVESEANRRCGLCGEEFTTAYDDEEDEWVLTDAVRVTGTAGALHRRCFGSASQGELEAALARTGGNSVAPNTEASNNHGEGEAYGTRDDSDGQLSTKRPKLARSVAASS